METFLTTILFIFVGFWLLSRIGRLFLRWWIPKKQREFNERFSSRTGTYANQRHSTTQKEGEITVTHKEEGSYSHVNKGVGDYVEYEDVKDSTTFSEGSKS